MTAPHVHRTSHTASRQSHPCFLNNGPFLSTVLSFSSLSLARVACMFTGTGATFYLLSIFCSTSHASRTFVRPQHGNISNLPSQFYIGALLVPFIRFRLRSPARQKTGSLSCFVRQASAHDFYLCSYSALQQFLHAPQTLQFVHVPATAPLSLQHISFQLSAAFSKSSRLTCEKHAPARYRPTL